MNNNDFKINSEPQQNLQKLFEKVRNLSDINEKNEIIYYDNDNNSNTNMNNDKNKNKNTNNNPTVYNEIRIEHLNDFKQKMTKKRIMTIDKLKERNGRRKQEKVLETSI